MPKPLATAAIVVTAFAAGACSSGSGRITTPPPAANTPLPPAGGGAGGGFLAAPGGAAPVASAGGGAGSCNAAAAQFLVGELATSVAVDKAKEATGAETVRILYPGQPVTQEFVAGRLDLDTDDRNRITAVRCG
ncbi:I78 family peptidase inhibitor [Jiella sonneratiae]|uniref:Proteinase inhibitor I78 n=1 Tax=Jiella sonneratiae TaxID=2816856 RepID=A0ABS3J1G1_9HYPH|nr:I78 family peptidase inhibitor [Jiella sonneratiae]MBO0902965.1 hypothetical protein [Jiella sonneratiae]